MRIFLSILGIFAASVLGAQQNTGFVSVSQRFWVYLPEEYGGDPARRWPLVVFLHGSGERGADLNKVKVHGPPKLADKQKFPFILISPQCPAGERWSVYMLNKMLDELLRTYPVDEDRVYLTGLSMGGQGTWLWAIENPERFAAIAPVCGRSAPEHAWRLRHMPAWVFHGKKDLVVPPGESEKMIAALQQTGSNPRFTWYADAGHDSWTETYNNPELYSWLLEQRRNPHPEKPGYPESYPRLVGRYRMENMEVEIFAREGNLWAKNGKEEILLKPDGSPGVFYFGNWFDNRLSFNLKAKGKARSMKIWNKDVFGVKTLRRL